MLLAVLAGEHGYRLGPRIVAISNRLGSITNVPPTYDHPNLSILRTGIKEKEPAFIPFHLLLTIGIIQVLLSLLP